jgi:hypothetical protein
MIVPLFCERFFRAPARKISKNYAAANAFGDPDSLCSSRLNPYKGLKHRDAMALRRVAMPCSCSPQATKNRLALRLLGTNSFHSAAAPFPRFSAYEIVRPDSTHNRLSANTFNNLNNYQQQTFPNKRMFIII